MCPVLSKFFDRVAAIVPGWSIGHFAGAMKNLILLGRSDKQDLEDFESVRSQIGARARDINVFVINAKSHLWPLSCDFSRHPTITVSPMPLRGFRSPRGPVFQGFEFPKGEQYSRLAKIGIRVPDWQRIEPDTKLDPDAWGPYVVVKPELGRKGAGIQIKRTTRVRYKAPDDYPDQHPGRKAPMLAQRFIYSGPWASCYRVVTLFGKALLSWHCEIDHSFRPLESRFDFKAVGGITIVSNKPSSRYRLAFDEDVIAFAEAAHDAFPEQALLGHDVVRDHDTGDLFIMECNPRGDTWLFSSYIGEKIQIENGIDFYEQFGGLSLAADILIDETRHRAA